MGFLMGPVNIGSEEMLAINGLVEMMIDIFGKKVKIRRGPERRPRPEV